MMMMMIIIIINFANRPAFKLLIARPTDQGSTIEHPYAYARAPSSSSLVVNHHAHAYIICSNAGSQIANQKTPNQRLSSFYQGCKYSNTGSVNTIEKNNEHLQYRVESLVQKVNMSLLCDSPLHRHRSGDIPFAHSDVEHRVRQA